MSNITTQQQQQKWLPPRQATAHGAKCSMNTNCILLQRNKHIACVLHDDIYIYMFYPFFYYHVQCFYFLLLQLRFFKGRPCHVPNPSLCIF
jgi:hypothetical protein